MLMRENCTGTRGTVLKLDQFQSSGFINSNALKCKSVVSILNIIFLTALNEYAYLHLIAPK